MKTITIKGTERKSVGKAATKSLREQNQVPCVLYGGEDIVHFYASVNDLRHLLYTPNVYYVNLEIADKTYKAIMKDNQFHPITDIVMHIDFYEMKEGELLDMFIPVHVEGLSKGVQEGGVLKQDYRYLKLRALPKNMPEEIKLDVTSLEMGQSIKVGDLDFKDAEILENETVSIVGVVAVKGVAEIEAEAEAAAEAEAEEDEEGEGEEGEETEEGAEEGAEDSGEKEGEEKSE